jgi:shikimate dehydrogenase
VTNVGVESDVIAAVIGSPVQQSLSPVMHNAVFAAQRRKGIYVAIEVEAEDVEQFLRQAQERGLRGLSVTMPLKEIIFSLLTTHDVSSVRSGSVNTVLFEKDGSVRGLDTDGSGCCEALAASGIQIAGSQVVVLGAGPTARSIISALAVWEAADIAIVNRTPARAQKAANIAPQARVGAESDIAAAAILINATSVGMGTTTLPIEPGSLHDGLVVFDVVYSPLETALLQAARNVGAVTIDGLQMLVHQAALQQKAWFGVNPDVGLMRSAALSELRIRSVA